MDRNDILKTSYLNQKEAANKFNNAGYKYDDNLSSNDAKVFVDENGKPNIAFRTCILELNLVLKIMFQI